MTSLILSSAMKLALSKIRHWSCVADFSDPPLSSSPGTRAVFLIINIYNLYKPNMSSATLTNAVICISGGGGFGKKARCDN
jgi:hypothetical protein